MFHVRFGVGNEWYKEGMFYARFVLGKEWSRERTVQGTNVPLTICSR